MSGYKAPHRNFALLAAVAVLALDSTNKPAQPKVIPTDGREEKPGRTRSLLDRDAHPRYDRGKRQPEYND